MYLFFFPEENVCLKIVSRKDQNSAIWGMLSSLKAGDWYLAAGMICKSIFEAEANLMPTRVQVELIISS